MEDHVLKVNDKSTETKLPVYHGTVEKEFHLWELHVNAALRGKDMVEPLKEGPVKKMTSEKALSVIILALGDGPLRSIGDCNMAKESSDKLQHRKACKTMLNKLIVLNSLLITMFTNDTTVRDHVAHLESQPSRLAAMRSSFEESLEVAILLSST